MSTTKTLTAAAGMAVTAALLAPAVPAQAATVVAAPSTVGTMTGFTGTNGDINAALGPLCAYPNVCQTIFYNTFVPNPFDPAAQAAFNNWVNATQGPEIGVGYSLGAAIMTVWIAQHPDPAGEDLRFILFGNPLVGATPGTVAYPVTEVIHEYDNAVDPPQEWWNLLAVLNFAVSGRHCCYNYNDLTTTDARVYVDGDVTYRLIDTYPLPIIAGLDPSITVWLDPILRPIIDSAYHRTYQQYPQGSPTTATVTSTQEVSTLWTEPTTLVSIAPTTNASPAPSTSNSSPTASDSPGRASKKAPKRTSSSTDTTSASPNAPSHRTIHKSESTGKSPTTGTPKKSSASNATGKKSEPKPKHEPVSKENKHGR